jgi:hypothetical protein
VPERKGKEEESMDAESESRLLGERRMSAASPDLRPEAVWGDTKTGRKSIGSQPR